MEEIDFSEDIKSYVLSEFKSFGIDYSLTRDINKDLLNLFTIQKKYIYPFPRIVQLSNELQTKIKRDPRFQHIIRHLIVLLAQGLDVNQFQSINLFNYRVPDQLIYDWSIYHLHLSINKTKYEYFNDRTNNVLFAFIDKEQARFLDIDKHPPKDIFADKKLLEILDKNWNEILKEADGVVGLSQEISKSDRFKLRKMGINEGLIEVNGKFVFTPGIGFTSNKTSTDTVLKLNMFNRWIEKNTKFLNGHRSLVDKYFKEIHNLINSIEYHLSFKIDGPEICDKTTNQSLIKYSDILIDPNTNSKKFNKITKR